MRHQRLNTDGKTLESRRNDEHTTGVGPAASRCLSEDEVMRLCAGEISEEHLGRIDEHLDRCEACQRWVAEVMAHGTNSSTADDASTYPAAFRAGTMAAGRFRIVRFIKRGGMGEVYEAFDSVLEQRVALKTIISTACDSPRAMRKLKAEVQLARSIRHPNVCSVFDIWEHRPNQGDGSAVLFFTMEFIDGLTMRQVLERSLFALDETLRIARLELLGLRAAHDTGVVHRDFKSDNVMLRSDRHDDGQVVVMDFGLARTLQKEGGATNDSEQFAGSVAYMAPEQVEGKRHIGPEADVFAFGVVMFEMLTGELPWVGDSPWTTAALRLTQRAPAPSRLRPGLSPRLDAFVLKCLSREPSDRFRDARETLVAFDELLSPAPRRTRSWLAVAGAALLLTGVAVSVQQRTTSSLQTLQPSERTAIASTHRSAPNTTAPNTTAPNTTAPNVAVPSTSVSNPEPPSPAAPSPAAPSPAAPNPVAPSGLSTTPPSTDPAAPELAARAAPPAAQAAPGTNDSAVPRRALEAATRDADGPESRERAASGARSKKSRAGQAEALESRPTPPATAAAPAASVAADTSTAAAPAPERHAERAPGAPAKLRDFE